MNFWKELWLALPALLHFYLFFFPSLQATVKQFFAILQGRGGSRSWCHVRQLRINTELGERSVQTVGLGKMNDQLCGMNDSIRERWRQVAARGPCGAVGAYWGSSVRPLLAKGCLVLFPPPPKSFLAFVSRTGASPSLQHPLDFIDWSPLVHPYWFVCLFCNVNIWTRRGFLCSGSLDAHSASLTEPGIDLFERQEEVSPYLWGSISRYLQCLRADSGLKMSYPFSNLVYCLQFRCG